MADVSFNTKHKQQTKTEQNQPNPSKYFTRFLLKALLVAIFLVILPLFPAQAPESIDQSLVNRSWELLHLLFVGIAVSYGLFSRRNDEPDKENNEAHSKFDNAQSYVCRFLQVSSFFEDDSDSFSGSDDGKVQTWNHQYYRSENPIVSEAEHSVLDEHTSSGSQIREKPLLLPVRSLKSHASEKKFKGSKVSAVHPASVDISGTKSGSSSKRFATNADKAALGGFGGLDQGNSVVGMNENVVLRSPIPWRSRSGKMEVKGVKEEIDSYPSLFNLAPSMEESELSRPEPRSLKSQTSRSSRPSSASSSPKVSSSQPISSPKKLSPSPSLSTESQAKQAADSVRKKSIYACPPPPPPPPPPPQSIVQRSSSWYPKSSEEEGNNVSFERTMRPRSFVNEEKDFYKGNAGMEMKQRGYVDGSFMGKSVRTIRSSGSLKQTRREIRGFEDGKNAKKMGVADQASFRTEKLTSHENAATYMSKKPTFLEEQQGFLEKVTVETDEESEDEEDEGEEEMERGGSLSPTPSPSHGNSPSSVIDGASDVDKKAEEFIAKIREQISCKG